MDTEISSFSLLPVPFESLHLSKEKYADYEFHDGNAIKKFIQSENTQ